jgi:hypothetical protein
LPAVKRICLHHAGCPDGFGAAWAVWRTWRDDARYIPCGHDDRLDPQAFDAVQLVFVDIAPPNQLLRQLGELVEQVVVLDHHLSARDRFAADPSLERELAGGPHHVHFDLDHSGAILAWEHFHPNDPVPELLRYIEDQDLWRWKLPRSQEVNAAIGSYPQEFEVWDELAARPIEELASEGEPIARANQIEVERTLKATHPIRLGRRRVQGVNAPRLRSALGHELAKRAAFGAPWGLVYRFAGGRVHISLYSIGDLDVSEVAAEYGGGGHRNAAGFSVPLADWLQRFV